MQDLKPFKDTFGKVNILQKNGKEKYRKHILIFLDLFRPSMAFPFPLKF